MTTTDTRIVELLNFAEAEGLTLPLSPETITAMEERGHLNQNLPF
jgi:hypothetical protein